MQDQQRRLNMKEGQNLEQRKNRFVSIGLAIMAAAALTFGTTALAGENGPEPIASEQLTDRHEFTDEVAVRITITPEAGPQKSVELDDATHLAVIRVTVQPGARFPWHSHPGPVLVSVVSGELVYVDADNCRERAYPAGTAFVDPGFDNVHTAFNAGDEETVLVATFLGAPAEGELTIPVDRELAATLDEQCGLEPVARSH
jgi:quercetin dioxygenase-like cupin family protein